MHTVVPETARDGPVTGEVSPALRRFIRGLAEIAVDLYLQELEGNRAQSHEREGETVRRPRIRRSGDA